MRSEQTLLIFKKTENKSIAHFFTLHLRSLLRDYDRYAYIGFIMSLWILPVIISRPEDTIGQDEIKMDPSDPASVAEAVKRGRERMEKAIDNEPQIKRVMGGNFLEMVERGFFDEYVK